MRRSRQDFYTKSCHIAWILVLAVTTSPNSYGGEQPLPIHLLDSSVNFADESRLHDCERLIANNYFRLDMGFSLVLPITQPCRRSLKQSEESPVRETYTINPW